MQSLASVAFVLELTLYGALRMRRFLLRFVFDKEHLRFADGLRCRLLDGRLQLERIGLLGQHIDDGLLLDGRLLHPDGRLAHAGRRRLNEHNAIMFAWWAHGQHGLWIALLWLLGGRHVHIDVLGDDGTVGLRLLIVAKAGALLLEDLLLLLRLLLLLEDLLLLLLRLLLEDLLHLGRLQRLLHETLLIQAGRLLLQPG